MTATWPALTRCEESYLASSSSAECVRKPPPFACEGIKDLEMGQPFMHAENVRVERIFGLLE